MKGYKTVIFSVLVFVIAIANLFGFADFKLSAEWQEALLVILPLVTFALRYLTDSKIFSK